MAYGLNLYHSTGSLAYSSSDVTWNQVDAFQANGGYTYAKTYSVISGKTVQVVQMFIDPPPTDRKALAHTISRGGVGGTGITVYGGNETSYIIVLMR
jgi:hypothetical protein